jgi:hypothetical protein
LNIEWVPSSIFTLLNGNYYCFSDKGFTLLDFEVKHPENSYVIQSSVSFPPLASSLKMKNIIFYNTSYVIASYKDREGNIYFCLFIIDENAMTFTVVDTLLCPDILPYSQLEFKIFYADDKIHAKVVLPTLLKVYCFSIQVDDKKMFSPLHLNFDQAEIFIHLGFSTSLTMKSLVF